jgi:hypothetical protein
MVRFFKRYLWTDAHCIPGTRGWAGSSHLLFLSNSLSYTATVSQLGWTKDSTASEKSVRTQVVRVTQTLFGMKIKLTGNQNCGQSSGEAAALWGRCGSMTRIMMCAHGRASWYAPTDVDAL